MECSGFAIGSTLFWFCVNIVIFIILFIITINDDEKRNN